jgi:hypothetical protein
MIKRILWKSTYLNLGLGILWSILTSCTQATYNPAQSHLVYRNSLQGIHAQKQRNAELSYNNYRQYNDNAYLQRSVVSIATNGSSLILKDSGELKSESHRAPYELQRFPVELSGNGYFLAQSFAADIGFTLNHGITGGLHVFPIKQLGAHAFGSSLILNNHRWGLGLSVAPWDWVALGYHYAQVNAFLFDCTGSCGLGSFIVAIDSKPIGVHSLDIGFYYQKMSIFLKHQQFPSLPHSEFVGGFAVQF